MIILALDLAEYRIGWAKGEAGKKPNVGVFSLKNEDERIEDAIPRLGVWLVGKERLSVIAAWLAGDNVPVARSEPMLDGVDLVAVEDYVPIGAKLFTNPATQEAAILMNGAVRMACGLWGVPIRCPDASKVRVHFCGQKSAAPHRPRGYKRTPKDQREDRAATKAMVIKRAQMLGYIPRECQNDDLADACALYDFASSHWGRKATSFQLMG